MPNVMVSGLPLASPLHLMLGITFGGVMKAEDLLAILKIGGVVTIDRAADSEWQIDRCHLEDDLPKHLQGDPDEADEVAWWAQQLVASSEGDQISMREVLRALALAAGARIREV